MPFRYSLPMCLLPARKLLFLLMGDLHHLATPSVTTPSVYSQVKLWTNLVKRLWFITGRQAWSSFLCPIFPAQYQRWSNIRLVLDEWIHASWWVDGRIRGCMGGYMDRWCKPACMERWMMDAWLCLAHLIIIQSPRSWDLLPFIVSMKQALTLFDRWMDGNMDAQTNDAWVHEWIQR